MDLLRRLLAIYLIVVALAVAVNWIATPLYHDGSTNYWLWEILNWFMAVAVVIILVTNSLRELNFCRREAEVAITREYLETNWAFAASIVLTLWYFWNWFNSLFPDNEPAAVGLIHLEWWAFINPLFVLVAGFTSAYLGRCGSGK